MSGSYHNMTAHFNAFFIADENMTQIEQDLYTNYQWNYNKILPIYPSVDSAFAQKMEAPIKECVEMASIAIQRHEGSRWEDDSYLLVGKARYYALEFPDAIETFKYINKEGQEDEVRHAALIQLIKTFVDFGEINNAIAVSDFLKREKLNTKNLQELSLVRAYLFQKRKDLDQMVQNLVAAEALMPHHRDRARVDFIIGQVYQQLGFESEAYNYYQSCLRNTPTYELSFYAKLNMAQVTQLTNTADKKRTRKYFKKLLKDPKNKEYRDKIYYEMAGFELKQGNLDEAIDFYKKSAWSSVKNQRQKAYSYLKLGQIYYDSLKNFELAQTYYDSTVATMPGDEENFDRIKQRQQVLNEFVKHLTVIRTNDSLIALSKLPEDSLLALVTSKVMAKEKAMLEKKEKEERRAANLAASSFDPNSGGLISTSLQGATWYFYNPTAIARGSGEFKRIWGSRPLEDNWRRANKAASLSAAGATTRTTTEDAGSDDPAARIQSEIDALIATVPGSDEAVQKLLLEIEPSLYALGNIYYFKLEENTNAILTFESLLERFPETASADEVLYQLYLLYKKENNPLAEERAHMLKTRFPQSIYAKLIDNPNYREESQAATAQLKSVYTRAYRLYEQKQYEPARQMLDSAIAAIPDNSFTDNLALLSVILTGHLEDQYKYQYELNNFIKTYPESEMVSYAQNLVVTSENYQINLFNSAKARFVEYFNQKHYYVVVYPNNEKLTQTLPSQVEAFVQSKNLKLTTGNLILNQSQALVLVNDFPAKGSALKFLSLATAELPLSDLHKGEKIYTFVITQDNFDIFYQTKDVNAYLNFFEKHYQQEQ